MPAAPSSLVAALRNGTCARHMFFKMTHTDGTVLAWDGVGDFAFGGDTYSGVANLMDIGGVSNSSDIQNHAVTIKLNGVPLPVFRTVTPTIRNETAELRAVWIDATSGTVITSKLLFSGLGDFLTTRLNEETIQVTANIRAPSADWAVIPRAYYTNADQSRLFPGDTGCDYTAQLENAVIAGWQATAATAAALLYYKANLSIYRHIADGSGDIYGHDAYGCLFQAGGGGEVLGANSASTYKDGVLNNNMLFASLGQALTCNGVSVQLDGSLNAISGDGNPITRAGTGLTADKLRKITAISSTGTATARVVRIATLFGKNLLYDLTAGVSGENYSGVYFPDSGTHYASLNSSTVVFFGQNVTPVVRSDGVIYFEQGTDYPLINAGAGLAKIMRDATTLVDAVRSTNGVMIASDTGNRIVAGGAASYDAASFLRNWT